VASEKLSPAREYGTVSAILTHVTTLVRYAGFVALVLTALVVVMVCGEGLCESCAHVCLSRVDRADRFRRTIARILAQFASAIAAGWGVVVAALAPGANPVQAWRPPSLLAVAPLRI